MNRTSITTSGLIAAAAATVVASVLSSGPASASRAVPHCGNADLRASFHAVDAGMSHRWGRLVLVNRSDHACSTGGFGGLSYVGHGDGSTIGAPATRSGAPARTYVLKPGQRLHSQVQETVAAAYPARTCRPTHVDGFRVYVPGARRSQYVVHPTTGCASTTVQLLDHHAFVR